MVDLPAPGTHKFLFTIHQLTRWLNQRSPMTPESKKTGHKHYPAIKGDVETDSHYTNSSNPNSLKPRSLPSATGNEVMGLSEFMRSSASKSFLLPYSSSSSIWGSFTYANFNYNEPVVEMWTWFSWKIHHIRPEETYNVAPNLELCYWPSQLLEQQKCLAYWNSYAIS